MFFISRLTWGENRIYDSGLDRGVFYPKNSPGEVWDGLCSIVEQTSESGLQYRYIDGVKTYQHRRKGYFLGTIEAISYPKTFFDDILTQRKAKSFGLSYRTGFGEGHKIHLAYNLLLADTGKLHETMGDDLFRWNFTTKPVPVMEEFQTAHIVIDTNVAYSWTVFALEEILYGTETEDPRLPAPAEVLELFEENSILQIIDHGDGTWTAIGPDDVIVMLDSTTFQITWPSAVYINASTYTIHSL